MPSLSDPVRYLTGVGPEMARRLARLEIRTIRDLLFHVPRSYRDRRQVTPIAFLRPHEEASVLGALRTLRIERRLRGRRDASGSVQDETGALRVVWFNQAYVERALTVGARYYFSGPVEPFHGLEMHNPEFEPVDPIDGSARIARVTPVYGLTQGVAQRWLRARVEDAIRAMPVIRDLLPEVEALGQPAVGNRRVAANRRRDCHFDALRRRTVGEPGGGPASYIRPVLGPG